MRFANPELLWGLLAIPVLASFLYWAWKRKIYLITQFVPARLANDLTVGVSKSSAFKRSMLLCGASLLITLSLARPQWGYEEIETSRRGLDILLAVDLSTPDGIIRRNVFRRR